MAKSKKEAQETAVVEEPEVVATPKPSANGMKTGVFQIKQIHIAPDDVHLVFKSGLKVAVNTEGLEFKTSVVEMDIEQLIEALSS